MSTLWYTVMGLLFMASFALGGLDQGVALLLPALPGTGERRAALNAVGPRFLGNEVWIVGAVGVLAAAFPRLEGELFGPVYPVLVVVVLGLLALNAGVQLRGRSATPGGFDLLITLSATALATGWGLVLGATLHGPGPWRSPAVWTSAPVNLGLVAVSGLAYLSSRGVVPGHWRRRTAPVVAALVSLLMLEVYWQRPPDLRHPMLAALIGLAITVLVLVAGYAPARYSVGAALAACALPVMAIAVARYPGVPVAGALSVAGAAAGDDALRVLTYGAAPLLPVLVAAQLSCWWLFRRDRTLYW